MNTWYRIDHLQGRVLFSVKKFLRTKGLLLNGVRPSTWILHLHCIGRRFTQKSCWSIWNVGHYYSQFREPDRASRTQLLVRDVAVVSAAGAGRRPCQLRRQSSTSSWPIHRLRRNDPNPLHRMQAAAACGRRSLTANRRTGPAASPPSGSLPRTGWLRAEDVNRIMRHQCMRVI